jgi:hypothetical protein
MDEFFCECVNSMRMRINYDAYMRPIKFNDAVFTRAGRSLNRTNA